MSIIERPKPFIIYHPESKKGTVKEKIFLFLNTIFLLLIIFYVLFGELATASGTVPEARLTFITLLL